MTIRASKPGFNLREKLKELTHSIGLKGSELMRAATAQDARDLISAGRKNLVINGDVRIVQRGTSATVNNASSQTIQVADRWNNYHATDGAVTESQSTDVPAESGFYYSLKHEVATADTSIAAEQFHSHKYDIEGYDVAHLMWGTPQAKPITVSFWAKSSVVGDYGFCIRPGLNNTRFYVDTLTISQANAWEKYSFTIPGCTDGTWGKINNVGMEVQISLVMGTTYQTSTLKQWITTVDVSPTSQVNWMATVGNTWYITGLQVEVGKNATDFEYRSYGEEIALCQRYFELMTLADRTLGKLHTLSQAHFTAEYKERKRDTPSVISNLSNVSQIWDGSQDKVNGSGGVTFTYQDDGISIDSVTFRVNVSPAFTGSVYRLISGYGMTIAIDAEL